MENETKQKILELIRSEREARAKALTSKGFTPEQAHAYIAGFTESTLDQIEKLLA